MKPDPIDQTQSLPGFADEEPAATPPSGPTPTAAGQTGDEPGHRTEHTPSTALRLGARAPSAPPIFAVGDVVATRFRIVRFIARGGMGEVYEAEDLELHEPLALKTIRPEVADEPEILERFRQEIYLARKVTDPNVCRIFDVFHHFPPAGPDGTPSPRVTFLTMELLKGETLADHLRRVGPLDADAAVPLLLQVCEGLEAAHRVGVVHCDLKSSNIVLEPSDATLGARSGDSTPSTASKGAPRGRAGSSGSGPKSGGTAPRDPIRVVITDFGLARGKTTQEIPSSGKGRSFAGSPAYIAPEQITGAGVSPATDLYALGVVMYEVATGLRPFVGANAYQTARMRLREDPVPPSHHRPNLDSRLETMILKCLERDPNRRPDSAQEVADALRSPPGSLPQRQRRVRSVLAITAAALVLVAVAAWWLWGGSTRRLPPIHNGGRPSVAVLGFKNLSGQADAAWLSTAVAEMLSTELSAGERLRIIPGETITRMKSELEFSESDALARDTLARIRAHLGADFIVLGSYLALSDAPGPTGSASASAPVRRLRLDIRLQDSRPAGVGDTLLSIAETGTESELFQLVSRAGQQLRTRLEAGELSKDQAAGVQASRPSSAQALQLYAEGLEKLRRFDPLGARELLEKAAEADPTFPLARSALSEAWLRLGYQDKSQSSAKEAFELSGKLAREERLQVEGAYRRALREWDRVVEINRVLWGFFPDNLEYGLQLAEAQLAAGRGADSMATVRALRSLAAPANKDARIDLAEARSAAAMSDFPRARDAADRAAKKGQTLGARHLVAQARLLAASALTRLGDPQRSIVAASEAQKIFTESGDRYGAGRALAHIGNYHADQGELEEAQRDYEDWLKICQSIGNRECEAGALNNLGNVGIERGDLAAAKALFERALTMKREVSDLPGVIRALNNIARISWREGDLSRAQGLYDESLALCRETGNRNSEAATLHGMGRIRWLRGDLASARQLYEEARAIAETIGNKSLTAEIVYGQGEIRMAEGRLTEARQLQEQSLAVREGLGEGSNAAENRLMLAIIDIAESNYGAGEIAARKSFEQFERERERDEATLARGVVARAILGQGKARLGEALEHIGAIRESARTSQDLMVRLTVAVSAARIDAALAAGDQAAQEKALQALQAAIDQATAAGFLGQAYSARLAQGEVELGAGKKAEGEAHLRALEREAGERGFQVIVGRIHAILK